MVWFKIYNEYFDPAVIDGHITSDLSFLTWKGNKSPSIAIDESPISSIVSILNIFASGRTNRKTVLHFDMGRRRKPADYNYSLRLALYLSKLPNYRSKVLDTRVLFNVETVKILSGASMYTATNYYPISNIMHYIPKTIPEGSSLSIGDICKSYISKCHITLELLGLPLRHAKLMIKAMDIKIVKRIKSIGVNYRSALHNHKFIRKIIDEYANEYASKLASN